MSKRSRSKRQSASAPVARPTSGAPANTVAAAARPVATAKAARSSGPLPGGATKPAATAVATKTPAGVANAAPAGMASGTPKTPPLPAIRRVTPRPVSGSAPRPRAQATPAAAKRVSWAGALVGAIPFILLLYDLYLGIAEWNVAAGSVIGYTLTGIGFALFGLTLLPRVAVVIWPPVARRALGEPQSLSFTLMLLGLALAEYSSWRTNGDGVTLAFSLLCLVLAAADTLLIVRQQALAAQ